MRLDKYLADAGAGTRSELKKAIRQGAVTVDGTVVKDPGYRLPDVSGNTQGDGEQSHKPIVMYRGISVTYEEYVYYMLHKPAGIISASEDRREKTVVDLITDAPRRDLFPVGRLDRDTEGLLLITNDGPLAHRLLSPRHHVDKVYFALTEGTVTQEDVDAFRSGLRISGDFTCLPAGLEILEGDPERICREYQVPASVMSALAELGEETRSCVRVTIREGKFHQVRRMFHVRGKEVLYLKRLSMGPLTLDESLEAGAFRRLTDEEIQDLKNC